MQTQPLSPEIAALRPQINDHSHNSGVAWGAVFAGAAAAAALSFILLILGVGLGLSSVSPWSYNSAAIGTSTIVWVAFMQLAASGIGGYMAGRLRVKWAGVHQDEVHFRDTAHGLLAWAVATLLTVSLLASGISAIVSGAVNAGAGVAAAGVAAAAPALTAAAAKDGPGASGGPTDYFADMLLRGPAPAANGAAATAPAADGAAPAADGTLAPMPAATTTAAAPTAIKPEQPGQRGEINRILVNSLGDGKITPEDRTYLAQLIASRTGMTQADAERRVDDVYARAVKAGTDAKNAAKAGAETARKAAARSALWMFVGLLLGAFVASMAATWGGRQRDHARVLVATRPL